jgi:hypothetical protein
MAVLLIISPPGCMKQTAHPFAFLPTTSVRSSYCVVFASSERACPSTSLPRFLLEDSWVVFMKFDTGEIYEKL